MRIDPGVPEVWLRGALPGIPPLLQPAAHGLRQCQEEMHDCVAPLTLAQIWTPLPGVAPIGFHLRHAARSLDRLLTYARGEQLSPEQLAALASEGAVASDSENVADLLSTFDAAIARALKQLGDTPDSALLEPREVGRARLPSTTLGLLFHAAEHTQRHVGQIVVMAKVLVVTSAIQNGS